MPTALQQAKNTVRNFYNDLLHANSQNIGDIVRKHTIAKYDWYGVHPFNKLDSQEEVIHKFWQPLYHSWSHLQRREDIFIAGYNEMDNSTWTISMGHFMGVMDKQWLGIPATNKITFLRYAEFNCVKDNIICKSAMFLDIIYVMNQAGCNPLPMQTGTSFLYPGPLTHDGLLFDEQESAEGELTLKIINKMIADLSEQNTNSERCPPQVLEQSWHKDMIWYGPCGIGATYTIPRYQKEHQYPFRDNLIDKQFNGHVCRLSEGKYAGFFGWPNLSHKTTGGFLGLPAYHQSIDMRVVDIYRREGDKLAENWVIIDLPYWLLQQGVDVLARCNEITTPLH